MESKFINGVRIYAPASRQSLIDYAFSNHSILVAVNAEKILHATEKTRSIINRNLGYPDGIGAVLGLQKKGLHKVIKIPGCELWLDIVRTYYQDKSFYLIGGTDSVIETTVYRLQEEFTGIRIVNYRNGYLNNDAEKAALIKDIAEKKPDIVFVAMGSPRQELLIEEIQLVHPAVYQGLGGSFDVYTGLLSRAPDWWVNNNLEWLYRLLHEPSRIWRQLHLIRFLALLMTNRI